MKVINVEDIQEARRTLEGKIEKTEMSLSQSCSQLIGCDAYLKFENLQKTGSFKIRGAFNKLSQLTSEEKRKGVVASSAGNHAQGVAFSATQLGVPARVVMPKNAPLVKVEATRNYGAEVIQEGLFYDEAYHHAKELAVAEGALFVHPYEDPAIIAGQGTIGLEILDKLTDLDSIVIPIGGGGLVSGVATAIRTFSPRTKIFGVQSKAAPGMAESLSKKQLHQPLKIKSTIADGIAVKKPSAYIFENYIKEMVDDIVMVEEDAIAQAMVFLLERAKSVVEGSGAVSLAAASLLKGRLGKKTCLVLSGGNVDLNIISRVIERGLSHHGRLSEISVVVEDRPGRLSELTNVVAEKGANIIEVHHDRYSRGLYMHETRIDLLIETTSWHQIDEIKTSLLQRGARLDP